MGAHAMQHGNMDRTAKAGGGMGMAFILGAAIGTLSGLLFAPKSGRETRQDIKHKSDDVNDMAHSRIEQVRNKAHEMTDKMKRKNDETLDRTDDLEVKGEKALRNLEAEAEKRKRT